MFSRFENPFQWKFVCGKRVRHERYNNMEKTPSATTFFPLILIDCDFISIVFRQFIIMKKKLKNLKRKKFQKNKIVFLPHIRVVCRGFDEGVLARMPRIGCVVKMKFQDRRYRWVIFSARFFDKVTWRCFLAYLFFTVSVAYIVLHWLFSLATNKPSTDGLERDVVFRFGQILLKII